MHLRPPTPAELASIEDTRAAYRAMWAKLKNVPARAFDGGRADIDALDFIDYEIGDHPEGLAGAAVIWGGVLVATGALEWAVGDEQHFVLMTDQGWPRALIWPYARRAELQHSSAPHDGRYDWLLEEAVLRLRDLGYPDEVDQRLAALLRPQSDGFLHRARRGIDELLKRVERPKG